MSAAVDREGRRRRRHIEEMRLAIAEGLSLDAARMRLHAQRCHQSRLDAPSPRSAPAAPQPAPAQRRPFYWEDKD